MRTGLIAVTTSTMLAGAVAAQEAIVDQQDSQELLGGWVIGAAVDSDTGERIGSIDDILIGADGQITAGIVSVGGFLGFGAKDVAIDWDEFEINWDAREVVLSMTRDELEDALEKIEAGEGPDGLGRWDCERRLKHVNAQIEAIEAGEELTGLPTFAQVLALGDVALVGWPGEVFCEIAQQVREQSPFVTTLDVTHVGGSIGYVPVASAYEDGGYEIRARAHHRGLGILPEAEGVMVRETLAALAKAREALG